ncbi:MAG: GNAT family N-acetyltransferase [Pseudomonadota bacterium]
MSTEDIQFATSADIPLVARTLSLAFATDPIMMWVFKRPDVLEAALNILINDQYLPYGRVIRDGTGNAAALWMPSTSAAEPSLLSILRFTVMTLARGTCRPIVRGLPVSEKLKKIAPRGPHTYLFMIGVHPTAKGTGLGGQILRRGLNWADRQRTPVYLETSKHELLAFYQRYGFRVQEMITPVSGSPTIWTMLREP